MNLPNLFTLVRLFLTPFIGRAILIGNWGQAILLFALAGVSDAVDGYLARRLGASTALGAYFDPIADKILLSVIYISLAVAKAIPWWAVAIVFGRDLLILLMAAYALLFTSLRRFPPSILGKISTVLQIAAALAAMAAKYGVWPSEDVTLSLMLAGTLGSGFHYAWRGVAMLRAKTN